MKRASVGMSLQLLVFGVLIAPWSAHAGGQGKNSLGNDPVLHWNAIALEAVVHDHSGTYGDPEQGGPTRASRALAIVHIAIFDAVNAIDGSFTSYNTVTSPTDGARVEAAVAQAAYETLADLYPNQKQVFERELKLALNKMPKNKDRDRGIDVGLEAAIKILEERDADNSDDENTHIHTPTANPPLVGEHVPDPLNPNQGLLGPGWGGVMPFSMMEIKDVRTPAPPALNSAAYAEAFVDVLALGIESSTMRTKEETEIGLFWAYDGSKDIGVPPVFYNQVVRVLAKQEKNTMVENARLFALANIAMGDAGIAAWDSKYYYNLWRPIVAIRNADFDNNDGTEAFENWTPLGAPASNQSGNNFTPPFPAYPSGHATFGAAMFRTLANFYGTDNIPYKLKSDEMSGKTTDNNGVHRYSVTRRYDSFSQGMIENGRSRVYLGIHWQFDAEAGIDQGMTIADHVFETLLRPAE